MSAYFDRVKSLSENGDAAEAFGGSVYEAYPNLCDSFLGRKNEVGQWCPGPATLMVFCEAGKMKFCLSPKYHHSVCFGTVDDLEDVAGSVERSLHSGACDWKPRGGKK